MKGHRTYLMQGDGRDGRAALQPSLHRPVDRPAVNDPKGTPAWLRELRRDTREQVL